MNAFTNGEDGKEPKKHIASHATCMPHVSLYVKTYTCVCDTCHIVTLPSWQMREENEAIERSVAVAKGELDQMTTIFEAHARYLKVDRPGKDLT